MSITKARKAEIIEKFQKVKGDTGSSEVQIALLTESINAISAHHKARPNDLHCRRGLLKQVNLRRSLLAYLKRTKPEAYSKLIAELGLRH